MTWTYDDQARADAFAARVVGAVRESGIDPQASIHGFVEALGALMREDLAQRPARLATYLAMLAALVDHVMPAAADEDTMH